MKSYYCEEKKYWKLIYPTHGTFIYNSSLTRINEKKADLYAWRALSPPPKKILNLVNGIINNKHSTNIWVTKPIFGFKAWQWFVNYCLIFSSRIFVSKSKTTNSVYVTVNGFKVRFSDHPAKCNLRFNIDASCLLDAIIKFRKLN